MDNPDQDARRYRAQAQKFRTLAEDAEPRPRETYLHLAKAYDEVAERLDEVAVTLRVFVYETETSGLAPGS